MSRTLNSIKNIKYSMIGQVLNLLASFITRRIFIMVLSTEYLGLNGLFTNILSILSLAELGVGSAIIYSMYKPLAEKDETKLKALMGLYKTSYISIGIVIIIIGLSITPYLDFFIKDMPDIPNIRIIFMMYVLNAGFSYFFSYKRSLLIADQRKYVESFYHYLFYILRNIFQIIILLTTKNFFLYITIQLLTTLVENIVIAIQADKYYPFLKDKGKEKLEVEEKKEIFKNIKALMLHKIGSVIVMGTDNVIISKFVGIIQVGIYSNYILIINALSQVFDMIFQSITASIGNLAVTEKEDKNRFIFDCSDLLDFWLIGFASIALFNLFNPFINIWVGEKYLFPMSIVSLIVISFYLTGRRKSVLSFREAMGLFWYDRYKPIFEALINLIVSISLATRLGVEGVIIGTIVSTITTCFWVEPYILYKHGFKSTSRPYFLRYIKFTIIMIIVGAITWVLTSLFPSTFLGFIGKMFVTGIVPNILFLLIFWRTKEFQYIYKGILSYVKR